MNINLFQKLGTKIDSFLRWFLDLKDSDLRFLFWGGLVSASLVFLIEHLRKPKIGVSFLEDGFDFNLPQCNGKGCSKSKNWKAEVKYEKSSLNRILFKYSLNNLKIKVIVYNKDLHQIGNFQAKPDFNPNVCQERDIPAALAGINLTYGESCVFPFINRSNDGWLLFEVWQIFLCVNRRPLQPGIYYIRIDVISDQKRKTAWKKFEITNYELKFHNLIFLEKIKLKML